MSLKHRKRQKVKIAPKLSAYKEVDIRDEGKCRHPGCKVKKDLTHHHILEKSNGGKNNVANLILLCPIHHTESASCPHKSDLWRNYWILWAMNMYPRYWENIEQQNSNNSVEEANG